jgi:hypothetical protein
VERSDTHRLHFAQVMDFAKRSTHPASYRPRSCRQSVVVMTEDSSTLRPVPASAANWLPIFINRGEVT